MTERKRVLHITSAFSGGIYSFIRSKLHSIDSIRFDVIGLEEPPPHVVKEVEQQGGQVFHLPNPKKEGYRKFQQDILEILNKINYDMVHCHLIGHRAWPFYHLSKKAGIKRFVIHAHSAGVTETKSSALKTQLIESFDRKINQWMNVERVTCGEQATKYTYGKTKQSILFLPNSIDTKKFLEPSSPESKEELLKREGLPQGKILFGQIGRIEPNKNQWFTLSLAEKAKVENKPYVFLLIGEGRSRKEIEKAIQEKQLSEYVKLLGRKTNIIDYYRLLDGVLIPSYTEGFGIVAIEAQAAVVHCLVSETLSKEIDIEVGLCHFLSLKDRELWWDILEKIRYFDHPPVEKRANHLERKNYSNETSASMYEAFVFTEND